MLDKMSAKRSKIISVLIKSSAVIIILLVIIAGYIYFPWPLPDKPDKPLLISHRGVHQTFPLENIGRDQCTATIIHEPTHEHIENTKPSIEEAFSLGADIVELDIHRTADNSLIVFHDWTLDCRTNGTGVTNQQTVEYMKSLDVGHGYTADGGKTFPLRGKGVGLMMTLQEVLQAFPNKEFAIDNKDGDEQTRNILLDQLAQLPDAQVANLHYDGTNEDFVAIQQQEPGIEKYIYQTTDIKECAWQYLRMMTIGGISARCKQSVIALPVSSLDSLPGWPHLILYKTSKAGVPVYITDVDTKEDYEKVKDLPIDGIVTNKIEVLSKLTNS